jgi:hypothetical protein
VKEIESTALMLPKYFVREETESMVVSILLRESMCGRVFASTPLIKEVRNVELVYETGVEKASRFVAGGSCRSP